ncbi:hypothetical protein [Priestia megaterium]|uniref:hypothetical protein n=1 Tax=Priestia megaterium TaxID=1404 RepID=UPI0028637FA3|nr:hypothetical protein [Priestia megaterium]MDR7207660.1 hypothetical protein [Priestia megaterium]
MAQANYTNISVRLSEEETKALEAVHRYENRGMGKVSKAQVIRYSFLEYIKQNPAYKDLIKGINLDVVAEEEE